MTFNITKCNARYSSKFPDRAYSSDTVKEMARRVGIAPMVIRTSTKARLCRLIQLRRDDNIPVAQPQPPNPAVASPRPVRPVVNYDPVRCGRKSRRNPNPYTMGEIKQIAMDMRVRGVGLLKSKTDICYAVDRHLKNRPAANNARPAQPAANNARPAQPVANNARPAAVNDGFNPIRCKRKSARNPNPYTKQHVSQIARNFGLRVHPFASKTAICEQIQRFIQNRQANQGLLRPPKLNANFAQGNPLFQQMPAVKDMIMKIQAGRVLSRREQEYLRKYRPQIETLIGQITNFVAQQTHDAYVPQTEGLGTPPKDWKPATGSNVNLQNKNALLNHAFLLGEYPNKHDIVYIVDEVNNGKVKHVYDKNSLIAWLKEKAESPMTRVKVNSWNSIKQVPIGIVMKHANAAAIALGNFEYMQKANKPVPQTALNKIKTALNISNFETYKRRGKATCHVKTQDEYNRVRTTCSAYVTMLRDYLQNKPAAEQKRILQELGKRYTACLEGTCGTVRNFVMEINNQADSFMFDEKANKMANISNAANHVRNKFCKKYKKAGDFLKAMRETLYTHLSSLVTNRFASDGKITRWDIDDFIRNQGEYLLDCPGRTNVNAPDDFKFKTSIHGLLYEAF